MNDSATAPARYEPAWPQEPDREPGRVNRPLRAVAAVIEVLFAVAATWGAVLCWSNVVTTVTLRGFNNPGMVSRIYSGPWIAVAIALGLVAAVLLVDAFRELMLALRIHH